MNYCFLNRQPTLWRHGIAYVSIIPEDNDNLTIGISPLTLEPYNADYDGDTVGLYFIHDEEAIKEAYKNAHIKNVIHSDSNNEILYNVRHESLYAAFILSTNYNNINTDNITQTIINLNELVEEIDYYNNSLYSTINFNGNLFTYGICLLNKWCGFNEIIINEVITKKSAKLISNKLYEIHKENFHEYLSELNKKLLMFISITNYCPTLNLNEMINILDDNTAELFLKLPDNNAQLGYLINESLIDRCINNFDKDTNLYKLFRSGSRFNKQQLARSCINIGYVADDENNIVQKPVKTNLLKGQTEEDFFMGSPGSRKGIVDKSVHVPNSGYMERALTMALSILEIVEEDCHSNTYLKTMIFNEKHCETIVGKYYKFNENDELNLMTLDIAKQNIGKPIYLRSPMTCQTSNFKMCNKCFGDRKYPTRYVGIIAGQCLSERLTQLIMRSFHTSGSAILDIDSKVLKFFTENLNDIQYINDKYILIFKNSDFPEEIKNISGFVNTIDNTIIFDKYTEVIKNKDTIQLMLKVKQLLKTQRQPLMHPFGFYEEMTKLIIEVETPYSSFIEMLFANMFACNLEKTEFWRYNQDKTPIIKFGDKNVVSYINKSLYTLFQPNQRTLKDLNSTINTPNDKSELTIYERIWMGNILDKKEN